MRAVAAPPPFMRRRELAPRREVKVEEQLATKEEALTEFTREVEAIMEFARDAEARMKLAREVAEEFATKAEALMEFATKAKALMESARGAEERREFARKAEALREFARKAEPRMEFTTKAKALMQFAREVEAQKELEKELEARRELRSVCVAACPIGPLLSYTQRIEIPSEVTDQQRRRICWAHAIASVIHLALRRILGRQVPKFLDIRAHLLEAFGDEGQCVNDVLIKVLPDYKLHYKDRDEEGAKAAVCAGRPVLAVFELDANGWGKFSDFYRVTPKGTLTAKDMEGPPVMPGTPGGHAAVLVGRGMGLDTSLTFMNSWGATFADRGFFTVDKASTLKAEGGRPLQFYDVYWTVDDLSEEEKKAWRDRSKTAVNRVEMPLRPSGLPVECPYCRQVAPAIDSIGDDR